MAKESNGVTLPASAVKDGGNVNNDQAIVGKGDVRVSTTKNGNVREDR